MAKKSRMGRNLNALLGGATKNRPANTESDVQSTTNDTVAETGDRTLSKNASGTASATSAETSSASEDSARHEPTGYRLAEASRVASTGTSVASSKNDATDRATVTELSSANEDRTDSPSITLPNTSFSTDASTPYEVHPGALVDAHSDTQTGDRLRMIGVDLIVRGEYQPRRHFDQTLLQELADSIKAQGLIQPILVRATGGKFELIAGERRWRAAQLAGITDIPAIVREMDDQSVAAVSLIENIQRADLNPLEEAHALERLCGEFSMTHQQVAEAVGRSRVSVTNLMRLLELHDDVKNKVDNGELDMGHARALLGAPRSDQSALATRIIQQGLTVRAVEKLVRQLREGKPPQKAESAKSDPNIEALGKKLSTLLGATVNIKHQKSGSGKLEINYSSVDELDGILAHIK